LTKKWKCSKLLLNVSNGCKNMFLVIFGGYHACICNFATLPKICYFWPLWDSKFHQNFKYHKSSPKLILLPYNKCRNMFLVIFGANETPISDFATLSQFSPKSHFSAGPRLSSLTKK
jgi:glycopeptide antibiotics resistance protein